MKTFATRLFLCYCLTIGVAVAAPLMQVKGGKTTIYFSDDMLEALTDCRLERVKPSVIKPDRRQVRLTVVGGALDSATLSGEVEHNGGINIVCWGMGTESAVTMQNFMLDSLQELPQITALVSVDDGETERIPVLLPGGDLEVDVNEEGNQVRVRKVELMFTEQAADILENLLVIPASNILGSTWSRVKLRSPDQSGNGEGNANADKKPEKGEGKNKDKDKDNDGGEEEGEEEGEEGGEEDNDEDKDGEGSDGA